MKKTLKETKSSFCNASVETLAINETGVLLKFYDMGSSMILSLPIKYYTKRFLKNAVDAYAVGSNAEKIAANAERLANETF